MRASLLGRISSAVSLVALASLPLVVACGGGAASTPGATTPTPGAAPHGAGMPDHPESDKVTWKKDAAPKSCHTGNKGDGDRVASVTSMAKGCVDTGKMHQVGTPSQGENSGTTGKMGTTIPLKAQANHCYRVFGIAEATVTDFDIAVMDSTGKSCGEDSTDGNDALVLEDGNICFKADDDVSVNVAVATGTGKWAVEIWSD